MQKSAGVKKTQ